MESGSEESWSDSASDEADQDVPPIKSRAYQIEMFELSLRGNLIAVMGTGSGKTYVAKLRIEAEFQRSTAKRVWFTAPSVVLAYQQYCFLSRQLPSLQFRIITGMDNAEFWKTQEVWDKALLNVNVVVSTPRILLDALNYGFISLAHLSLLVIDEAHHCVGKTDQNATMQLHYHPFNGDGSAHTLPHILALTASPITKKSTAELHALEVNLNAKCVTPIEQYDEYTAFLNLPKLENVTTVGHCQPYASLLVALRDLVDGLDVESDPMSLVLKERDDADSHRMLEKFRARHRTPAMKDLQSLFQSAVDLHENVGSWAADTFISAALQRVRANLSAAQAAGQVENPAVDVWRAILVLTQTLPITAAWNTPLGPVSNSLAPKVDTLLGVLLREYQPDIRALVFVKARHSAWALTAVINAHQQMHHYHAFSFVGVSNPAHQKTFDFANLRRQNDNLEQFRRGGLNLCVATSVLEEGIDVPAMNLVVCYDDRPNVRSFIQSRGRARHRASKFVILRTELDPLSKIKTWEALESQMREECADVDRHRQERETIEEMDETNGEVFRVESTGATLNFVNARDLLQRFCARLPSSGETEDSSLTFCVQGEVGVEVSATVYLPCSLPASLQVAHSKVSWRTEKTAKRDAAFQAYMALYRAGLVTDNLLPPVLPKTVPAHVDDEEQGTDSRASTYVVQPQYNPWPDMMESWKEGNSVYAHRLRVGGDGSDWPTLVLCFPFRLPGIFFPLHVDPSKSIEATLGAGNEVSDLPVDVAREITLFLLNVVFGRRLQGVTRDELPFLILPEVASNSLEAWYASVSARTALEDHFVRTCGFMEKYLLRSAGQLIPYVYDPCGDGRKDDDQVSDDHRPENAPLQIRATRMSRRLDFLSSSTDIASWHSVQSHDLPVDQCQILGLPVEYGLLMLLIPSITHVMEIAIRTSRACDGPLSAIGFQFLDLVSQALTLPAAADRNYERLEFLGDDLLKYYASIQLFLDYPDHPESLLTTFRERLVSNSRLQRATRELKLDRYLTRHRFHGAAWTAGVTREDSIPADSTKKHLSSKTLADVVEAVIGAAYLEGLGDDGSEAQVVRALQLFMGEVQWQEPAHALQRADLSAYSSATGAELLAPVESLIGYSFQHHGLLAEALTQSWIGGTTSSYNRLEFLGDAVLDHIVKMALFRSPLVLDPEQMTVRRHALVSHATLAFFALQTWHSVSTIELDTDTWTGQTREQQAQRAIHLPDYLRRVGNRQFPRDRELTLAAYHGVRDQITHHFLQSSRFPWVQLLRVGAPKSYSDVIESILGAVYVDSGANLEACTAVLEKLGYMTLVRRFASDRNLDVTHPEQVLSQLQARRRFLAQHRKSGWRCKVMVNDEVIAHAAKRRCRDEAQCAAARRAVVFLSTKRKRNPEDDEGRATVGAAGEMNGLP